jgi:hypothetical protein
MSEPSCETCRFWRGRYDLPRNHPLAWQGKDGEGECRRNPPFLRDGSFQFVITTDKTWCGEHQEKTKG